MVGGLTFHVVFLYKFIYTTSAELYRMAGCTSVCEAHLNPPMVYTTTDQNSPCTLKNPSLHSRAHLPLPNTPPKILIVVHSSVLIDVRAEELSDCGP